MKTFLGNHDFRHMFNFLIINVIRGLILSSEVHFLYEQYKFRLNASNFERLGSSFILNVGLFQNTENKSL